MHGTETEINWNQLPVSCTDKILQVFQSAFKRAHHSDHAPLPCDQDWLGTGTASGITSTCRNGEIFWGSWSNTPPFYPNMRGMGARYLRGASVIGTIIWTGASLGRSDRDIGRLRSIFLKPSRWLSTWMWIPWNLPWSSCTCYTVSFNDSDWASLY